MCTTQPECGKQRKLNDLIKCNLAHAERIIIQGVGSMAGEGGHVLPHPLPPRELAHKLITFPRHSDEAED